MSLSKLAKKTAQTAKNIGETLQDLEHLQEYGFASHPPTARRRQPLRL